MVHRAPDSRLLTNLIAHEKDYAKHFAALFPPSHAALASLSAYAAAAPDDDKNTTDQPRPIAAVVDVLASADDALQRYTHAVDTWRDQLVALKTLEDDLVAVLRDRDILVTRLIKASRSTREPAAHRASRLVPPLSNHLGSTSLSSLPSTNSTATSSAPANTNAKLAQAEAELRACEAHLVVKERELDARRISVARDGLGARCRALIDCGWVWSEMGKQGLKALQALGPATTTSTSTTYASDSSITPSQSASQTRPVDEPASPPAKEDLDVSITLPPAHAIPELAFPTGVRASSPQPTPPLSSRRRRTRRRRPPSQHILEVSDEASSASRHGDATPFPVRPREDDASSDDERPGPVQVVDNDPFEVIRRSMLGQPTHASAPDVRGNGAWDTTPSSAFPSSISVSVEREGGGLLSVPGSMGKRQRKSSMAFFGSLRGLFRKPKERERAGVEWDEGPSSPRSDNAVSNGTARTRENGGWVTRTDARIKRGSRDSDDDPTPTPTQTLTQTRGGRQVPGARLRKGRPRENGTIGSRRPGADGWITDSPVDASESARSRARRGMMKRKKTSVADLRGSEQGHTDGEVDSGPSTRVTKDVGDKASSPPSTQHRRAATTPATARSVSDAPPAGAQRRSASLSVGAQATSMSVSSSASSSSGMSWRKPPPQIESVPRTDTPARTATESPDGASKPAAKRVGNGHAVHAQGHKRTQQSLMSIVADVVVDKSKARSLDVPRAPGSVLDGNGDGDGDGDKESGHVRRASEDQGQGQRAMKMPLRSALRNTSRTPSPGPAVVVPRATPAVVPPAHKVDEDRSERVVSPSSLRDSASISSYETGRESLDGDNPEVKAPSPSPPAPPCSPPPRSPLRTQSQQSVLEVLTPQPLAKKLRPRSESPPFTFPPPPVGPPPDRVSGEGSPVKEGVGEQQQQQPLSSKETPTVRRKSVRVSLQPTFSPSPPAMYDDDDGEGYRHPRRQRRGDVWADSSEEDEVYGRARRLLSLVGVDKGKGRVRS